MTARPSTMAAPAQLLLVLLLLLCASAVALSCGKSTPRTALVTATPPPSITPPAELTVDRGQQACYIRQFPAANIPSSVKGYRLATATPLPDGVTPMVKSVRFAGGGSNRVLEAEVCFTAEVMAVSGRVDAQLELRLFNADSEKLSLNDRLQPVRILPFSQALRVQ